MLTQEKLEILMKEVLKEAEIGIKEGNSPFASILIDKEGNIIEKAHNSQNTLQDRTAHAEFVLLKKAFKKLNKLYSLEGYSVVQNCEPCSMCMSLMIKSKIDTIYFGAPLDKGNDPYIRAEYLASISKHPIKVIGGILEDECKKLVAEKRGFNF